MENLVSCRRNIQEGLSGGMALDPFSRAKEDQPGLMVPKIIWKGLEIVTLPQADKLVPQGKLNLQDEEVRGWFSQWGAEVGLVPEARAVRLAFPGEPAEEIGLAIEGKEFSSTIWLPPHRLDEIKETEVPFCLREREIMGAIMMVTRKDLHRVRKSGILLGTSTQEGERFQVLAAAFPGSVFQEWLGLPVPEGEFRQDFLYPLSDGQEGRDALAFLGKLEREERLAPPFVVTYTYSSDFPERIW